MDGRGSSDEAGDGVVFLCAREGFESSVGDEALGSFDGRDLRELHAYRLGERREQLLVSMHERLHHELQWSTAWGVVAAMSGLLAAEGVDPARFAGIATAANSSARQVHEVFATTIGCGVLGVPEAKSLLVGNTTYLAYLDAGLALGGPSDRWPWQFRESAIQMLLRSMMQPAKLADAASGGLNRVRLRDLADAAVRPDERLGRVAGTSGVWWANVFEELERDHPLRGGDTGGGWERILPDDAEAMDVLKTWEEQVLIPRLQEVASTELRHVGVDVLDPDEYLELVDALTASFVELGPDTWQVEVLTGPRRLTKEPLGAERESILLRSSRLRAQVIEPEEFGAQARQFLRDAPQPHVLAVYAIGAVLRRQLDGLDWLPPGRPLLALAGLPNIDGSVPIAMMQPSMTPTRLDATFTTLPVVLLTTLSTTRERENQRHVLEADCAVVLVDLPLRLQVDAWLSLGTVQFRVLGLESPFPLNLTVFHVDEVPSCWFISLRSEEGFAELAQLVDRHPNGLVHGLELPDAVLHAVTSATGWLLGTWQALSEVHPDG